MPKRIVEPERELEVIGEYDVVVAGGGPGGLPAAVAAARCGAKTLLVERFGFLGGLATAGLVGPILGLVAHKSDVPVVAGLAKELCRRMAELGGATPWDEGLRRGAVSFDVECFKLVADALVREAGVDVLLHSLAANTIVEGQKIVALAIESKSGRQAALGKVFIDATGDADLAAWAGAQWVRGREADGLVQAMGTIFRLGGVGQVQMSDGLRAKIRAAVDAGELVMYHPGPGGRGSTVRPDELTVNVTRCAGDGTNARDLTRAEMAIRDNTWRIVQFYREHVPGLENAFLAATPATVGVRETRRIVGPCVLTGEDVVNATKSPKAVARCGYWIDIHCPLGRVARGHHLCSTSCPNDPPCIMFRPEYRDKLPAELAPPPGEWFDIPYGCLYPLGIDNLLVAGRPISADHRAHGATRIMATCMAVGQAAGTAAALAADRGVAVSDVDVSELRAKLQEAGALV